MDWGLKSVPATTNLILDSHNFFFKLIFSLLRNLTHLAMTACFQKNLNSTIYIWSHFSYNTFCVMLFLSLSLSKSSPIKANVWPFLSLLVLNSYFLTEKYKCLQTKILTFNILLHIRITHNLIRK